MSLTTDKHLASAKYILAGRHIVLTTSKQAVPARSRHVVMAMGKHVVKTNDCTCHQLPVSPLACYAKPKQTFGTTPTVLTDSGLRDPIHKIFLDIFGILSFSSHHRFFKICLDRASGLLLQCSLLKISQMPLCYLLRWHRQRIHHPGHASIPSHSSDLYPVIL